MKTPEDEAGHGGWGPLWNQAEQLGFRAAGNREPQEALEQGCNDEQCNWMCVSYGHSACLFSMGPYLCRPHTEFQKLPS